MMPYVIVKRQFSFPVDMTGQRHLKYEMHTEGERIWLLQR
jgi:hypothetical protein